jgi:hypothetical protein
VYSQAPRTVLPLRIFGIGYTLVEGRDSVSSRAGLRPSPVGPSQALARAEVGPRRLDIHNLEGGSVKLAVHQFRRAGQPADPPAIFTGDRVEVVLLSPLDEMEYTVTLLDAEDSFDVVVTYPDNRRITVFTMAKDHTYEEGDEE